MSDDRYRLMMQALEELKVEVDASREAARTQGQEIGFPLETRTEIGSGDISLLLLIQLVKELGIEELSNNFFHSPPQEYLPFPFPAGRVPCIYIGWLEEEDARSRGLIE